VDDVIGKTRVGISGRDAVSEETQLAAVEVRQPG
jgi:hypothetical protein